MIGKPRGTDASLLGSLPWTVFALGISVTPHIPYLPVWITATFAGCCLWRYLIEQRRRPLPSHWTRGGLALVCFLGVIATYSAISGVGPGSALLAVMAALKLLETRQRRDQFVLLFISIFLVMSSLLREQYLWSLPYLCVATLIIMTAWLRMSAGESQSARSSFHTSGRLLLYAAPLALAMWIFFPRLASPFWAVPIDTSQATSGISDSMSPGDISDLSLSSAVAFRVQFDGDIPEPRDLYWRGTILSSFNGRTWSRWAHIDSRGVSLKEIEPRGEPVNYTVTMEPTRQQFVFALDVPTRWQGLRSIRMGPEQQLWHITPIEQRAAYEIQSHTEFKLSDDARDPVRWYSRLPAEGNERTLQLARVMREVAIDDMDFVAAVMKMFNELEFFYTLEPPTLGANPIDGFLFDTRQGFCEHYASAFTFMMRAAGIPARVVVGYQGGEVNPLGGHMIVRQSDAHAWSEVWIEELGWHRVDPTSAVAPERIEYGTRDPALEELAAAWGFSAPSQLWYDMQMTWDAVNAKWNDWVLGYGPEKQNEFMQRLGMNDPNWRKLFLTMITIVVALIIAISALIMLRYRPPPRDPAIRIYEAFVRKTGVEPKVGETALDFATRAADNGSIPSSDVTAVTEAYIETRYGGGGEKSLERLRNAVRVASRRAA